MYHVHTSIVFTNMVHEEIIIYVEKNVTGQLESIFFFILFLILILFLFYIPTHFDNFQLKIYWTEKYILCMRTKIYI